MDADDDRDDDRDSRSIRMRGTYLRALRRVAEEAERSTVGQLSVVWRGWCEDRGIDPTTGEPQVTTTEVEV
jgi:hypothetical protein